MPAHTTKLTGAIILIAAGLLGMRLLPLTQAPAEPVLTAPTSPQEQVRMTAQSAEPGGTPEQNLWQVLILMGVGENQPGNWDGQFHIEGGELHAVEGYRFAPPDRVLPDGGWRVRTEVVTIMPESKLAYGYAEKQQMRVLPKGVLMRGAGNESTRIAITVGGGAFSFLPMRLTFGQTERFLGGRVEVWRTPAATDLSGTELRQHDFPALGAGPNGVVWATWTSYHDRREELNLRLAAGGRWSRLIPVARGAADLWRPQVAADSTGRPWLIWAQQVDGNWDIYAMPRDSHERWGGLHRLSDNVLPDVDPHVAAAPDGTIYVVWQSFVGRSSKICLRYFREGRWSDIIAVTEGERNDWEPAVAAGKNGAAWIVWDRYNASYDVYARSFSPSGGLGPEMRVAASNRFEGHSTVAVDHQLRPWVAWETGGVNWGKDLGMVLGPGSPGSPLGDRRRIEVVCLDKQEWKTPAEFAHGDSLVAGSAGEYGPHLLVDPGGNIWLAFKRLYSFNNLFKGSRSAYWESYLTRLDGDRWTQAIVLPKSWSRNSTRVGMAAADGKLWAFWPDERRSFSFAGRPHAFRVVAGSMPLPPAGREPVLKPYRPAADNARPVHTNEAADIATIRNHRVQVGGERLRIVRGDLHRHTELSQDNCGVGDGSLPETYRYLIDAAGLDFGASTDHQGGGVDYWNFLSLKMADMFHFPDRFVPLYSYERNMPRPHGHRNIFHAQRDYPIVPFFQRISPKFMLPDAPDGELVTQNSDEYGGVNEDDTRLLYEELRKSGGVAIPHTTKGSNEWRDNNPRLDPVLEVYQGARTSAEHKAAPRSGNKSGFGYAWDAWKKGYRIGIIASSDHYSTHISYAMVYTAEKSRKAILDSIVKRRAYGATDNIVLEFWIGDHFMGDDFVGPGERKIRVKVRGTGVVDTVHLIRDGVYIHKFQPDKKDVDLEYVDYDAGAGDRWYYVRIEQRDGQLAWSSPIWVRHQ